MMAHVDLMIFDLDGTLVSSGEDIAASVNYTLEKVGLPRLPVVKIIGYIGDGVRELLIRALGEAAGEKIGTALKIFSARYAEHLLDTTTLYPGMPEVLKKFAGKRKAIVTNKRHDFAVKIVEGLGIAHHFDAVIGAEKTPYQKPDARIIKPLIEDFHARPRHTIVIGDGTNDILLAQGAGVLSCAYLNGLSEREALLALKPDFTYEDPAALKSMFY
jgi:phosphoglycolate phosphatase